METKHEQLENIHLSNVNGQRKQMVRQIDEYGLYDFWDDYSEYLNNLYSDCFSKHDYFSICVIAYHRIKNR